MQHQEQSGIQENIMILPNLRRISMVIYNGEYFKTKSLQDNSLNARFAELFLILIHNDFTFKYE